MPSRAQNLSTPSPVILLLKLQTLRLTGSHCPSGKRVSPTRQPECVSWLSVVTLLCNTCRGVMNAHSVHITTSRPPTPATPNLACLLASATSANRFGPLASEFNRQSARERTALTSAESGWVHQTRRQQFLPRASNRRRTQLLASLQLEDSQSKRNAFYPRKDWT